MCIWASRERLLTRLNDAGRRRSVAVLILVVLLILGLGTLLLAYFDSLPGVTVLWWALVGAGTLLAGVGLIGTVATTIVSFMVTPRPQGGRERGRLSAYTSHFVVCGWHERAAHILDELRADPRTARIPIVLLASLSEKPHDVTHFVRGPLSPGTMQQANVAAARAVIILGEPQSDAFSSDARAILTTHMIKTAYPSIYTCVELFDPQNATYCQLARADEIIVSGALSTTLLARAALDPGVTRVISELLHNRHGQTLHVTPMPTMLVGLPFVEAMVRLKQEHNALIMAVQSGEGLLYTNPPNTYQMRAIDRLYILAPQNVALS